MLVPYEPKSNPEQRQKLKEAYLRLYNTEESLKYLSFTQQPFHETQLEQWFDNYQDLGIRYYAAEDEDTRIIGILVVKEISYEGYELYSMIVDPTKRRSGLGRNLITQAVEIAGNQGYRAVDAMVFADNKRMLCLLLNQDFIPVRMQPGMRSDGMAIVHLKKIIG